MAVFLGYVKRGNVWIKLTVRRVRATIVAGEKHVSFTYSECVSVV